VDGDSSLGVHHRHLADVFVAIGFEQAGERFFGALPGFHEVQAERTIRCFNERLSADGTDLGFHPRNDRPDGKPMRLNCRPKLTCRFVNGDD
jgi:hypothetical protein